MAARVRALLVLHRAYLGLTAVQRTSVCFSRHLCNVSATTSSDPKPITKPENVSLLEKLNLMGVDVKMARRRHPGVLRKIFTNEEGVAMFLEGKGASCKVVASVISRYPRAITRSINYLEERWTLWRRIFASDAEIVSILNRSPESFFRSSDNDNLKKNIDFLSSLGLHSKILHKLLSTAPRTFSNTLELNKQMVECLEDVCADLGGDNPAQFAQTVISRNIYILIRSTTRMKDHELLALLQGPGVKILGFSNECLKNNFRGFQEKMLLLGAKKSDVMKVIRNFPMVLYFGQDTLSSKLDCLVKSGINVKQIVEKARVLDYSAHNIMKKIEELNKVGYDFQKNSISILELSQKRFDAKIKRLSRLCL
uniref:Mitochondrial transcription termination factor 1 n=1 Tax=Neogobius melanostomus TaxID=47308 RepID=A0A8C6S5B2_9GOBI